MNTVKTGCAGCTYYFNGQCSYFGKCSGEYSVTTNTTIADGKVVSTEEFCTPVYYTPHDTNVIYSSRKKNNWMTVGDLIDRLIEFNRNDMVLFEDVNCKYPGVSGVVHGFNELDGAVILYSNEGDDD